jgi:TrmH family RNA methyltransferase
MQRIESLSNAKIKRLKSLHTKKVRDNLNLFLIEGFKIVEEAIDSSFVIEEIYISDYFYKHHQSCVEKYEPYKVFIVNDKMMAKMAATVTPQGVIAVVIKREYDVTLLLNGHSVLLLDKVNDPGNLGTIIRSADAFDIPICFYTDNSVDVYNEKTIRSTMGSIFRIPYIKINDDIIFKLKELDYEFVAMALDGKLVSEAVISKKSMIVIGNEANGISDEILALCDQRVKIKMLGKAESLNAAIAASIIMYEITK